MNASMSLSGLALASYLAAKIAPRVSSLFRPAKKDSVGALSRRFARRLMLRTMP